jgi:RNA polymerase sigma-70 factor (ECF subfamily)
MPPLADRLRQLHDEAFLWALSRCNGRRADAKDVLQEVYLKVLDGEAVYSGAGSFRAWLFAVIKHTAADAARSACRETATPPDDLHATTPPDTSALDRDDTAAVLRQLLRRLSDRQEEALRLVFYHRLTIDEAAGVMGVAAGTARTHYKRGKARLRTMIADAEIDLSVESS